MFKDLKAFILKGNVMDLAVAVIIGAAFGKIVSSLVADILTPLIGLISGGIDVSGLQVKIGGTEIEPVYLNYGMFIQATIDFVIIATVIFMLVRILGKIQKPVITPVRTKDCQYCKSVIHLDATRCPHCTAELLSK